MFRHDTTSIITPSSHEDGELPSDVLVTLEDGEGMSGVDTGSSVGNGGGGDGIADFGDVDLNSNADIDMALCLSMEEERVMLAASDSSEEEKTGEDGAATFQMDALEEALLQQAIANSIAENQILDGPC